MGNAITTIRKGEDAQPLPSRLLNSERIERQFGHYGIEVIEHSSRTDSNGGYWDRQAESFCRVVDAVTT